MWFSEPFLLRAKPAVCPQPCGCKLVDSKLVGGCGPAEVPALFPLGPGEAPPHGPCRSPGRGGAWEAMGGHGRPWAQPRTTGSGGASLDARQLSWCRDTGPLFAVLRELSFPSPGSSASGGLVMGGHGRRIFGNVCTTVSTKTGRELRGKGRGCLRFGLRVSGSLKYTRPWLWALGGARPPPALPYPPPPARGSRRPGKGGAPTHSCPQCLGGCFLVGFGLGFGLGLFCTPETRPLLPLGQRPEGEAGTGERGGGTL